MNIHEQKLVRRQRRRWHVRKNIMGTPEQPRLSVCRSLKHIRAQIIDDHKGLTLCAMSTQSADIKKICKSGGNIASAKEVGKKLAELALGKGIKKVVFDRGCFPYHGRLKALADSARQAGLKF